MPLHHIIFVILFSYLIIKHLFKMIYLIWQPRFLSAEKFGMPSKRELFTYYLFFIFVCAGALLFYTGFLNVETLQIKSKPEYLRDLNRLSKVWIAMISAGIFMVLIETIAFAYVLKQKRRK